MKYRTETYINGNYLVKTSSIGNSFYYLSKRALRLGEDLCSEFPDSIDLKISNRCSHGCAFCHESSVQDGKVLNLKKTKEILSQLPRYPIEIAIGGGNILECMDETEDILDWLIERNYRTRITITLDDLKDTGSNFKNKRIENLILSKVEGLGISITNYRPDQIPLIENTYLGTRLLYGPQVVYHVIAGITPIETIKQLVNTSKTSILILGYKQWGRARNTKIPDFTELKNYIETLILSPNTNLISLGFDNLAIEQLDVKKLVEKRKLGSWDNIYLGDEGSCSMYIDAVNGEFAKTSRSPERVSWDNIKLLDFYASINPKRKI